ncbi:AAEL007964-PA [Aedes aegypti]|uniref:glutathione transferase n=2 Tax=Aedes aegypti TaxID=7159 RepID=Q170C9_AEDAE|nr:glutathione S-transferase epsilon 5 [Aedes aegypti]NP_001345916.1 glutathione S-transferase epsilon 5 [Aedes aegypti]NP_001345917.1 glutathione S-transferase epsilon 5 [Aedes aegypti]EAT40305.1 AAEL007964-PA [Aedes aegypti]
MTKPIVYTLYLSPPSRAVDLCAVALGIELERKVMNLLEREHLDPKFLKMNPQHTIPVLDDGGIIVRDSHAIMIYLVSKYGKDDSLYPKDLAEQAKVNAALYFDCGVLFARLRFITEQILMGGSEIPAEKAAYVESAYQLLEDALTDDFIAGNSLTIADLSCGSTVSTAMGLIPMDRDKYPKIYAWLNRLKALPYFEELNDQGAVELPAIMKNLMETNARKA